MAGTFLIRGVTLLDADTHASDGWLEVDDGVITAVGHGEGWRGRDAEAVDGAGLYLTPGFIDLHLHGGGGVEASAGPEELERAIRAHEAEGTTSALISLVSAPVPVLETQLALIADATRNRPGVLGSHLEGPFLAPERRGAHGLEHLLLPDTTTAARLIAASGGALRQVTLAPELPGALAVIEALLGASVHVAVGHTAASFEEADRAFQAGASLLTHTFNAMPGLGHREPGPVGAALGRPHVTLELIADGLHVHPVLIDLLLAVAPDRIAAVSDAMAAAASDDGCYDLGGQRVRVAQGRAVLDNTDVLAGSTLTLRVALANLIRSGVDPRAAIAAVTSNPARAIGIAQQVGALRPGLRGDLVLLDTEWMVRKVWRNGESLR